MMSIYAGVYAIASPLLAALCDQVERRHLLPGALIIVCLGLALTASTPNWYIALAGRALTAIGAAGFTPAAAGFVSKIGPDDQQGRLLGRVFMGLTFAQILGLPFGYLLSDRADWRVATAAIIVIVAVAAFVSAFGLPAETREKRVVKLSALIWPGRDAAAHAAVMLLHISAYATVFTFIMPLFESTRENGAFLLLAVVGIAGAVGSLLAGTAIDRFGLKPTKYLMLASQILLLPLFSIHGLPVWVFTVLCALWIGLSTPFMIAQQVSLVTIAPKSRDAALALNATANYLGLMVGSMIGAATFRANGFDALGWTGGAIAVLALLWSVLTSKSQSSSRT